MTIIKSILVAELGIIVSRPGKEIFKFLDENGKLWYRYDDKEINGDSVIFVTYEKTIES